MHIFFSGIGGTGIGPLALIAKQAGYTVSGSDKQDSSYVSYLRSNGILDICIGQTFANIAEAHSKNPIDWIVYSSAVEKENPDGSPEIIFARENGIRQSKRDEFINELLAENNKEMIAIAGTHGKTTTTAMTIWAFKQLGLPISYSVGGKLNFGEMGEYDDNSKYFVYEADEYDRNFLSFNPEIAIISGIDYDHPDIYPTRESYNQAFVEFVCQSNDVFAHRADLERIGMAAEDESTVDISLFTLTGKVNRKNAQLVVEMLESITDKPVEELINILNKFPGVSRRFENISENVYSDYAHTPEKIRGALQIAAEISAKIIVVYEGLHNTRQHFIKDELDNLFEGVKKLYIVPSYLAREDESLEILTPEKLCNIAREPADREPANLDKNLKNSIAEHVESGDLVLCLSAGGGGSLDEWLRREFKR
jgi:UDP-N-acetylmuramate--alanine ligase